MMHRLKVWAERLKQNVVTLYIAARDSRTPRLAKVIALFVVAYAVSPIDLIPDFIPILGLLDEVILVPVGIMIAVRFIPEPLWQEFLVLAQKSDQVAPIRWGIWIVICVWICCAALIFMWFF